MRIDASLDLTPNPVEPPDGPEAAPPRSDGATKISTADNRFVEPRQDDPSGPVRAPRRSGPGARPLVTMPSAPAAEGFITHPDGRSSFVGSSGDDRYTVSQNASGDLMVTNEVSGDVYTLPAVEVAKGVDILTAAGDDVITVDGSVRAELTLHGGFGDDHIDARNARGDLHMGGGRGADVLYGGKGDDIILGDTGDDRIYAGDGDDHVEGGEGDDRIEAGRGDDDVDGGVGHDRLYGEEGMDRLVGGLGDDEIFGGDGNDQVLGQDGDDEIDGGEGDDFVRGGDGADAVRGGAGSDALYADGEDTAVDAGSIYDPTTRRRVADAEHDLVVAEDGAPAATHLGSNDVRVDYDPAAVEQYLTDHPELVVAGDADFVARTKADLGAMLRSTQGQGLLDDLTTALAARGETLDLAEKTNGPGGGYSRGANRVRVGNWAATYGDGGSRHPLPVMFHELAHAYQDLVGAYPAGSTRYPAGTIRNAEAQVTGLPWIDASGTPQAADAHPYTDNKFRDELGLPGRTQYGSVEGVDPRAYVPPRRRP